MRELKNLTTASVVIIERLLISYVNFKYATYVPIAVNVVIYSLKLVIYIQYIYIYSVTNLVYIVPETD